MINHINFVCNSRAMRYLREERRGHLEGASEKAGDGGRGRCSLRSGENLGHFLKL